jgi:ABC-2 type transport system permease protein
MSKTKLIIEREYLSRVKKKSFIVMTILGPLLMAALMIIPSWLAFKDVDVQIIQVIDETQAFRGEFESHGMVKFEYVNRDVVDAKAAFYGEKYTAILYIPRNGYTVPTAIRLFHKKQPSDKTLRYINSSLSSTFEKDRLKAEFNLSKEDIDKIKANIDVVTVSLDEQGNEEETHSTLRMIVGFVSAVLIYIFIFLYGVQVMRGVIEEKTSRIVEVIISSVKPFQLMMGKIIGIALVGLTQFLLWVVLTAGLISISKSLLPEEMLKMQEETQMESLVPQQSNQQLKQQNLFAEINANLEQTNFPLILSCFLFYFMGGYLLYGALFAAIGSAVDNESDTQQFMLPITVPLIFSFMVAQLVIKNPDGALSFWTSIIPFTSPIIMMVRIPFGVDIWELLLSMVILVISFIGTTWLAGRIYRTGILMYGKKINYKELWKWLSYKI